VRICAGMLKRKWLVAEERDFRLTRLGKERLAALQVDVAAAHRSRRAFARACIDLTQRRPHLGGALGAALLQTYLARGWVQRMPRSRAVSITPRGGEALAELFG
ncbi:MAG TPA: transcriptional regulator, partial [Burkholderiales bacterium]|nr:transcriptional regulator [Burkholderiales bacterium]